MKADVATVPADLPLALDRLTEALAAIGSGDPAPYAALWPDTDDVTLFGAWGRPKAAMPT